MKIAQPDGLANPVVIVDFSDSKGSIFVPLNFSSKLIAKSLSKLKIFKGKVVDFVFTKIDRFDSGLEKVPHTIIQPESAYTMRGGGIKYKKQTYITHTTLPLSLSALKTFTSLQLKTIGFFAVLLILGLIIAPILTLKIAVAALSILYFSDVIFNLIIVIRSIQKAKEIKFTTEEISAIDESKLPVYSLICPLYREAHIFPQFLDAINRLDYPKEKLDVLLLLEEDDKETIRILSDITLPYYIRKVIVPHSLPKTKPKACNYGLSLAKGEYLVIYDAEDVPDPLQLKKAYLGFKKAPRDVQCLQAKLNYYNPRANLLTKFFTVEYALWFDIMLTGLQSFNSSLPLGGTSNHFRTQKLKDIQGWDPFNVTEDADLGVRLFQKGYRTAVIDSTTHEEATSKAKNWVRQRSRWLKGYMQTYLVHTRDYKEFIRKKGFLHYLTFQLTVGGKVLFILLNPVMWVITILYFAAYQLAGPLLETIYTPPFSYIAVASWIFGNFMFTYYYMIACGRKKEWDLMKYVLIIPLYWVMMSFAGMVALYQLIVKPHYWEKTVHGFHLDSKPEAYRIGPYPVMERLTSSIYASIKIFINNLGSIFGVLRFTVSSDANGREKVNHILILNWRDTKHIYTGGAEVYINELSKRWVNMGSKVTIFCGNDNSNKSYEEINGVEIIRKGGTYTVYLFAFVYYILKFRKKVDLIIDCENGIPFFSPLYARVPVILLIHHVHQEIFREFLKFPLRQIAAFLEGKVMPIVYKNKKIVTVSNSSMQEIQKIGFTTSTNIEIIPNGAESFLNIGYPKTPNPTFLYLGRLKNYKNVDIAIKAFAKIVEKYHNASLSIVGTGESYPKLKALAAKLNIEESVSFLGKVTNEQKINLFSSSWVVLQPSQMEGWGITVIEANSAGTPVIASRANGLIDSVVDGKTGLLVNTRDVDQFANAMQTLIQNSKLREELSQNAILWSRNFSWDKSAEAFRILIDRSIDDRRKIVPSFAGLAVQNQ